MEIKDSVMLEITKEWKLPLVGIEPFRMNIIAVSWKHKLMFIACSNRIKVFKILDNGELDLNSDKIEDIVVSEDKKINQIKVGKFRDEEVLCAVDMNAKLSVVNIDKDPFTLNQYENLIMGQDDNTVWSLDIFNGAESHIAAGSNAKTISVWDSKFERKVIEAHDHNVPCVQFSPCGKYVASTSIDKTVRFFDVKTGKKIAHLCTLASWGWSVNWIRKDEIYGYPSSSHKQEMDLQDYILFAADEKYLYLLNPFKEGFTREALDDPEYKPFTMEILSQFKFSQEVYYNYYLAVLHARFALCYYVRGLSTMIVIPQHTPWIHFTRIVYDQIEKKFTISSQHNVVTNNNSLIFGAWLQEFPEELEKKAILYLVTDKKEVCRVEINKSVYMKPLLEYTF